MGLDLPFAGSLVPSIGSTATSQSGPVPSPTSSPLNSMGAWSFSPSPITTTPFIDTVLISGRIAVTAAPSAPFLSPRPTQRPAESAAASVTLASSSARLRSGALGSVPGVIGRLSSAIGCTSGVVAVAASAGGLGTWPATIESYVAGDGDGTGAPPDIRPQARQNGLAPSP